MIMKNELSELLWCASREYSEFTNELHEKDISVDESYEDYAAGYLIANDVIVLPCKFLQDVYVLPTIENGLSDITEFKCLGFTLCHDTYCANLKNKKNKLYQPSFGRFGKTVFISREEAEQALGKEDEGK